MISNLIKLILFIILLTGPAFAQNLFPEQLAMIRQGFDMALKKRSFQPRKDIWGNTLKTIKLDSDFVGSDKEDGAYYLNDAQRKRYKITIKNGRFWDSNGNEFDTRGTRGAQFIMDSKGNIYATTQWKRVLFEHNSLAGGKPVVCAGYLTIHNSRLRRINDFSATYPVKDYYPLTKVITQMKKNGVNFKRVKVLYSIDSE